MTNEPSVSIEILRDISTRLKEATRLLEKAVEREMGKDCHHDHQFSTTAGELCRLCGRLQPTDWPPRV